MDYFFDIAKAKLKTDLAYYRDKFDQKFALTLDAWTATNQQPYFGITIHWINKNWQLESKLLNMISLKEKHAGLYFFRLLMENLKDFGIEDKIIG